jgi:hypothetical protein
MQKEVSMRIRKDLPKTYDENYNLSFREQTTAIEVMLIVKHILNHIRMPMVKDMLDGYPIISCLQGCLSVCLLTLINEGMVTEELYNDYKRILDEKNGIKKKVVLTTMEISDLSYDICRMLTQYSVVMGTDLALLPEKDYAYGNEKYFTPRKKPNGGS